MISGRVARGGTCLESDRSTLVSGQGDGGGGRVTIAGATGGMLTGRASAGAGIAGPDRRRHRHANGISRPPQEGREADLRRRRRGEGIRPRPTAAFDETGRPVRPHRLRPADHHRRQRQRPALPGPVGHAQRRLHGVDHHDAAQRQLPRRHAL